MNTRLVLYLSFILGAAPPVHNISWEDPWDNPITSINAALRDTIWRDYKKAASDFVRDGADVNLPNENGNTPLLYAIASGQMYYVHLLVTNKANVNYVHPKSAITPLIYAVAQGALEIAEFLVYKGADVNAVENTGNTPLFIAIWKGDTGMVEMLVDHDADVNYEHKKGISPLLYAMFEDHFEIAEILIDNGADINFVHKETGVTPIFFTILKSQEAFSELLIANGADLNVQNPDGLTPLEYATIKGQKEVAAMIKRLV